MKEAFAFWLGFEAILNLLNLCGFKLFRWLREAMEHELIPGLVMAAVVFAVCTPTSRYGLLVASARSYGQHLGHTILKLRVEQILKPLVSHHMRIVLCWALGTACIQLSVSWARSVLHRLPEAPVKWAPVGNLPQRKTPPPTAPGTTVRVQLISNNGH